MASYRQLPSVSPAALEAKTPWLSLTPRRLHSILVPLPGKTNFLGTKFVGAMLSFTIAHAAVIQLRRMRGPDIPGSPPQLPWRVDWPVFAGRPHRRLRDRRRDPVSEYALRWFGWLALGFLIYMVYRRQVLHVPLTETVRAPVEYGPAAALEFRSILVPIAPGYPSDEAMDFACRLAAERRASIVAFTAIEVPLDLPLDAELPDEVHEANEQLDEARAIGESYGVRVIGRIARTRNIGRAIVDEAIRRQSEIIVMAGPRRVRLQRGRRQIFGDAVDFVLRHAPCRVMVATPRERAA
jgi:nucleotide-binding universal stress UspA family protein